MNAVRKKEVTSLSIVKFVTIVTLDAFERKMKLSGDIGTGIFESGSGKNIRFLTKRKCPNIVNKAIGED